jgi:hypothetical protein
MRFSKAEPYESRGHSYRLWVVQTGDGYKAETIDDREKTISTTPVAFPSANEALDAARAQADADAERFLKAS